MNDSSLNEKPCQAYPTNNTNTIINSNYHYPLQQKPLYNCVLQQQQTHLHHQHHHHHYDTTATNPPTNRNYYYNRTPINTITTTTTHPNVLSIATVAAAVGAAAIQKKTDYYCNSNNNTIDTIAANISINTNTNCNDNRINIQSLKNDPPTLGNGSTITFNIANAQQQPQQRLYEILNPQQKQHEYQEQEDKKRKMLMLNSHIITTNSCNERSNNYNYTYYHNHHDHDNYDYNNNNNRNNANFIMTNSKTNTSSKKNSNDNHNDDENLLHNDNCKNDDTDPSQLNCHHKRPNTLNLNMNSMLQHAIIASTATNADDRSSTLSSSPISLSTMQFKNNLNTPTPIYNNGSMTTNLNVLPESSSSAEEEEGLALKSTAIITAPTVALADAALTSVTPLQNNCDNYINFELYNINNNNNDTNNNYINYNDHHNHSLNNSNNNNNNYTMQQQQHTNSLPFVTNKSIAATITETDVLESASEAAAAATAATIAASYINHHHHQQQQQQQEEEQQSINESTLNNMKKHNTSSNDDNDNIYADKLNLDAYEIANILANELFLQQLVSMECMQTGVPTLTTPTLTPTTLKSIEESFIQLTSEPINVPYQAGFIPPPLGSYTNASSSSNNNNNNNNNINNNNINNISGSSINNNNNNNNNVIVATSSVSVNDLLNVTTNTTNTTSTNLNHVYLGDLSGGTTSLNDYGNNINDSETENSQGSWNPANLNEDNSLATTDTSSVATDSNSFHNGLNSLGINTLNNSNNSLTIGITNNKNNNNNSSNSSNNNNNNNNNIATAMTVGVSAIATEDTSNSGIVATINSKMPNTINTSTNSATNNRINNNNNNNNMVISTIATSGTRRGGGRRPATSTNMTPEEEEKRRIRRERNKLAAARCRKRRVDQTNELTEEVAQLEKKRDELQKQIENLNATKQELQYILKAHACKKAQPQQPQKPHQQQQNLLTINSFDGCLSSNEQITGLDTSLAITARSISPMDLKPVLNDELLAQIKPEPLETTLDSNSYSSQDGDGPPSPKRLLLGPNNPMVPPPLPNVATLSASLAAASASLNTPIVTTAPVNFGLMIGGGGGGGGGVDSGNCNDSTCNSVSQQQSTSSTLITNCLNNNNNNNNNNSKQRPNSLPTIPRNVTQNLSLNVDTNVTKPLTDINGVAIQTPSTGMFNFDSLMDGGTGLTPVSGPLVPNCSTQNKYPLELVTPTSEPSKMLSL